MDNDAAAVGPHPERGDVRLLRGAAAGDPDDVRRLLDDVAPIVYGFIYARVGGHEQTAEDLLQETVLEAIRSASGYRGEAALGTWLCAIARHRLARHYEAERREATARSGLMLVPAPPVDDEVDRRDSIVRAMGRLPVLQRQVLVLKYLDDLSVAEIAGALNRTSVQVQSLLQRARGALRAQLAADHA